jgi:ATP synthase F1 delta subunit
MEALAEVYARSLFQVAEEHGNIGVIREQLSQFADALSADRELQVFFFSPYFSTKEKTEGLNRMLDGVDANLRNFFELLIEKHRMPALLRIRTLFDRMSENFEGLLPVQITSAIPLDPATAESLGARIGEQTGRKVRLNAVVDPEIIGGLILRVGNQILDASIHSRLERLRRQVATGA